MNAIDQFFASLTKVFVHQSREWAEIITRLETRNKYKVLDEDGASIGFIAEQRTELIGALIRMVMRSHRPMHIKVWNEQREELLDIKRPFHFFFSDMTIESQGKIIGHVYQRFAFIFRRYDLADKNGNVFSRIRAPFWRIWTFPVIDARGTERALISKKWGGVLKEIFTDEDKFLVEFKNLDNTQKAIVFASAITVDLDFFEENHSNR